ncbi:type-1 angiotensin II receptor B-like [Styela clava]
MNNTVLNLTKSFGANSSTSMNDTDHAHAESSEEFNSVVLPILYTFVCIVGLLGNGLVIYIMYLKKQSRNITDIYILNLAIADFIFVAMMPVWTTSVALKRWIFGQAICKLASGCTYFHLYASVFFLTAMSVDRFFAVVMHNTIKRTKFNATVLVIIIWMVSTGLGLLPLYFRNVVEHETEGVRKCEWTFESENKSHHNWFIVYFVSRSFVGFVIPTIIIVISYSMIAFFLQTREAKGKLTAQCQDRATRMVLVVTTVFLVCWLPNQFSNFIYFIQSLNLIRAPNPPDLIHYYVHMFTTCLAWIHSCMNPILYAFMREDMRLKLTEIMNKRRCCGDTRR